MGLDEKILVGRFVVLCAPVLCKKCSVEVEIDKKQFQNVTIQIQTVKKDFFVQEMVCYFETSVL